MDLLLKQQMCDREESRDLSMFRGQEGDGMSKKVSELDEEAVALIARRAHEEATDEGLHTSRALGRAVAAVNAERPEWTASEAMHFVRRSINRSTG